MLILWILLKWFPSNALLHENDHSKQSRFWNTPPPPPSHAKWLPLCTGNKRPEPCLSEAYTAISRKVVGKNVHATIPKGNMGYAQYTVPDTIAVEPTFVAFFSTQIHMSMASPAIISKQPTIPFGVVACTLSDNISRNSCIRITYKTYIKNTC